MIYHNINPVLLNIGPLEIRYYGLVYVLGILFAYFVLKHFAKKGSIRNLSVAGLDDLLLYITIGLLAGGRIFHFVFYEPVILMSDPLELFRLWHGGMSFHGSLAGIVLGTLYFCRKYKVAFYDLADLLVIPASLMLFFGRIANFVNGELIGTVTNVSWCIKYQGVTGCRHPSQIYEALKNLLIFFILLPVYRKRKLRSGTVFWLFVLLYGVLRFLVNFYRDDPRFLGISTGQYFSLGMAVVAGFFLYRSYCTSKETKS